jgi:hypothetical protein
MSRPIAFTLIWLASAVGIALGLTFCVGLGYLIGSFFQSGISGALSGLIWWVFGYAWTMNDMAASNATRIDALANYKSAQ